MATIINSNTLKLSSPSVNINASTGLHKASTGLCVVKQDIDNPVQNAIVWSPTAKVPPTKVFTFAQAKAVAIKMSEDHPGDKFYWSELRGFAEVSLQ